MLFRSKTSRTCCETKFAQIGRNETPQILSIDKEGQDIAEKDKKMQKSLSVYLTQADDLGRIVVPKEIRRTLRLREGTPLEIFTDREGEIILKKYSPMVELTAFAGQYAEAMSQSTGLMVCITDRDQVIAVAGGPKKDILQKNISRQLEQLINERQSVCAGKDEKNFIPLVAEELEGVTAQVVTAIICEGDAIGAVAILSREPRARFGEMEMKLASTAAGFLGRQMEG